MKKTASGFTIVELLVVITVIAIVAAISIISFSSIQARSRDTIRKQDIANLAKLFGLYNADVGNYMGPNSGCGDGHGRGWLALDYDGAGPYRSMNVCLQESGHLKTPISDPSGATECAAGAPADCYAYIKSTCTTGGFPGTYLYAHLETLPQSSTAADATCSPLVDTEWGINYVLKLN